MSFWLLLPLVVHLHWASGPLYICLCVCPFFISFINYSQDSKTNLWGILHLLDSHLSLMVYLLELKFSTRTILKSASYKGWYSSFPMVQLSFPLFFVLLCFGHALYSVLNSNDTGTTAPCPTLRRTCQCFIIMGVSCGCSWSYSSSH